MTRDQEAVEPGSRRRIAGSLRRAWPVREVGQRLIRERIYEINRVYGVTP